LLFLKEIPRNKSYRTVDCTGTDNQNLPFGVDPGEGEGMHSLLSRPINCSAYSERSCAKLQTKSTIQYEKSVQLSESFAHRTSHQGKCPWNRWSSAPDIRHPSTDNFWIFPQNAVEFMAPPCIGFGGPTMYWSLTSWP